jgi:hypothetical protein
MDDFVLFDDRRTGASEGDAAATHMDEVHQEEEIPVVDIDEDESAAASKDDSVEPDDIPF